MSPVIPIENGELLFTATMQEIRLAGIKVLVRRKRQMNKINRDDMLELTRRMTPKRNCFSRIAGAYFDEEGLVDEIGRAHV